MGSLLFYKLLEKLLQLFNNILPLSKKDEALLKNELFKESVLKNAIVLEKGTRCKKLSFVISGIFKVLKIDEKGNPYIPYFISEGHFAVDIDSFSNKTISAEQISALTPCTIITITDHQYVLFEKEIPNFSKIIATLKEKALLEKMKLKSEMLVDDAQTKYRKLLKNNPKIVQQIPQSQIALFLGISQFTLSRIKSKL